MSAGTDSPALNYEFRLARLPYLLSQACLLGLYVMALVFVVGRANQPVPIFQAVSGIAALTALVLAVGRFHDIGYSGWWSLLLLVPLFGLGVWVILFFARSAEVVPSAGNRANITRQQRQP
jgi:uncharacterized membrane protein YhaH (DUF805 family)